ncbi:SGNH/GDSL hydrolase family protein [Shinella sp. CPCC 101442]|uniref:SGNH/GDSL hydrolase family protein n=1 Tax=Shinella sp. CPCC 101442 TaxID=2932265 RepID=UPI002153106A|nr:SGNH/GDSL hydrolase family protein [Shinella sp. CPCC 101442]MCR6498406.1 SGNH/GDSL hydrolase family protein [Shinella sp. CPCC 101442]
MGALFDSAKVTYSAGPSANPDKPKKAEIIALFSLIENIVGTTLSGLIIGNAALYATRSAMYAAAARPSGSIGIVYNDSTAAYNGAYVTNGGTGSGAWTLTNLMLPSTFAAELAAALAAIAGFEADIEGKLDSTLAALSTLLGTATTLGSPADADTLPIRDSESSNVLKRVTWLSIKTALKAYFDGLYPSVGVSTKATPVDADRVGYFDSEAANAPKRLTWGNVKTALKAYFDGLYLNYNVSTKDTPVDADRIGYFDSQDANAPKRMTIANLMAAVKVVTDGLYPSKTIATDRLLGRDTAGTGNLEAIALHNSLAFSGSGQIGLADMAQATIKGRVAGGGTGTPTDLTPAQVRTMINVEDGANNYIHPSGDGNSHVPATGTVNNRKFLMAGMTAGSQAWQAANKSDVGLGNVDNISLREVVLMDQAWDNTITPLSMFKNSAGRWVMPTYLKGGLFGATGLTSDFLSYIWDQFEPLVPVGDVDVLTSEFLPLWVFKNGSGVEVMPVYLRNGLLGATGLDPDLMAYIAENIGGQYTDGTKLRRVYNALAAKVSPVVILGNGESWEDSLAIPQAQADILYARFGKSAQGHMTARGTTGINGVTQALSGGWTLTDIDLAAPTRRLGVDGYAMHTSLDTDTWVYGTMDFDEVFVFYDNSGSGTFRTKIGGTVVSTVVGNGTATSGVAHITSASGGASRVFALDTVGNTGEVSITDVFFFSSTLGVAYCKAGNSGTNAQQWAWISANFADIAASIVPDLLQLRLGINDVNQNTPIANFKTHLTTYVTNARAAWPGVEILLCMCPESGGAGAASRGVYAEAMLEVAKANNCAFFDSAIIGPYSETSADGLWLDVNHLNDGGARSLAFHQHRHLF